MDRTTHDELRPGARDERGVALLVAVMMLSLLGIIGLASMDTVMRDRQVAGFQGRARTALYAGDAGVATGMSLIRQAKLNKQLEDQGQLQSFNPPFPTQGAPQTIGTGSPQDPLFHQDPAAPQAVDFVGKGGPCKLGGVTSLNMNMRDAIFKIRVQGRTPEGARSTIEATTTLCHIWN